MYLQLFKLNSCSFLRNQEIRAKYSTTCIGQLLSTRKQEMRNYALFLTSNVIKKKKELK